MRNWLRRPSGAVLICGLVGLFFGSLLSGQVWDSFIPHVEVGQDAATVVAIMGEPTEKYLEPELVDGYYVDGANVLVYRYKLHPLAAGDLKVYFKNGKVVARSRP
jgi:hypothetical protein